MVRVKDPSPLTLTSSSRFPPRVSPPPISVRVSVRVSVSVTVSVRISVRVSVRISVRVNVRVELLCLQFHRLGFLVREPPILQLLLEPDLG